MTPTHALLPQVADLPSLQARLVAVEAEAGAEGLWDRPRAEAQAVMQAAQRLREEVAALQGFQGQVEDLGLALELLEMEAAEVGGLAGGRVGGWVGTWTAEWECRRLSNPGAGLHNAARRLCGRALADLPPPP